VALARLGRSVRLLAAIGHDAEGDAALASVAADGVDVSHIARRADAATFMCIVLLSPSGEKTLVRLETDAFMPRIADLTPASSPGCVTST
jgi:ribokinase